ncbi:PrpF domain-containing protein [Altericroceibacterium spongiae]|jgi:4-oxalomesaconate tautomerase|uniref:PrpF domain-containing protein n=1 Tax=Altericroceibacterium spongiae TaxID=2320269 RepID=UPI00236829B2|nr:PrpF domain-containing protein [Altericroceibacterium spongiae]
MAWFYAAPWPTFAPPLTPLQVFVDKVVVTDAQNCDNIFARIGPVAIERGFVAATGDETRVAICMENTGQAAVATVQTPGGAGTYAGDAAIHGMPVTHAPVPLEIRDTAGFSRGAVLPTDNAVDVVNGVPVT